MGKFKRLWWLARTFGTTAKLSSDQYSRLELKHILENWVKKESAESIMNMLAFTDEPWVYEVVAESAQVSSLDKNLLEELNDGASTALARVAARTDLSEDIRDFIEVAGIRKWKKVYYREYSDREIEEARAAAGALAELYKSGEELSSRMYRASLEGLNSRRYTIQEAGLTYSTTEKGVEAVVDFLLKLPTIPEELQIAITDAFTYGSEIRVKLTKHESTSIRVLRKLANDFETKKVLINNKRACADPQILEQLLNSSDATILKTLALREKGENREKALAGLIKWKPEQAIVFIEEIEEELREEGLLQKELLAPLLGHKEQGIRLKTFQLLANERKSETLDELIVGDNTYEQKRTQKSHEAPTRTSSKKR